MSFVCSSDPDQSPIFGVALTVAVARNKCHDGIQLPAVFRDCIDYIEESGMLSLVVVIIVITTTLV